VHLQQVRHAGLAEVRALPAGRSRDFRRVLRREWLRDRFWALPSLVLLAAVLLAALTAGADALGLPASVLGWPRVAAGTAETVLAVIATSMLTFVGVVFTITLVALQLASAQLSPRVLRTFVRSSLTKLAFGVFLATFAFATTMLVLDPPGNAVAESRSVTVAFLLVAASLVIFVVYATATMKLLQVGWVITAVAEETRQAVRLNFPPAGAYLVAEAPRLTAIPSLVHLPEEGRGALGVLLGIDRAALVELARRHGCVLELLPPIGSYLNTGAEVFAVHGGTAPPAARGPGVCRPGPLTHVVPGSRVRDPPTR
jgi:uncharacterized membrane protein